MVYLAKYIHSLPYINICSTDDTFSMTSSWRLEYIRRCLKKKLHICVFTIAKMAGLRKVECVQSNRGKQQVLLDGYTYSQNSVNEEATYWRWTKRPCKGKITTVAGFLRNSFGHDHPPSNETTVKFVSTMRKRARSETSPMQQIFNDELMKEADQDIPDIPTFIYLFIYLFTNIQYMNYSEWRKTIFVILHALSDIYTIIICFQVIWNSSL